MENFNLTPDEELRLQAMIHLESGRITIGEAATRLGKSDRQIYNMLRAFRERGTAAVIHGNRGRRPANAISEDKLNLVRDLHKTKYERFNHKHFTEMLAAEEGIDMARRSVSRHLNEEDQRSPRTHRAKIHRRRRERRSREGMLLQADGSDHAWLEDRGPKFTLVAAIDDASSKPWARFFEGETAEAYMRLSRPIFTTFGVPHAWYCDRDSIFSVNEKNQPARDLFFDEPRNTQFGRVLGQLGIELILANSPQAKGRIERFFDTAQDRLVSLLRLYKARTMAEANQVLPRFLHDFEIHFSVLPRNHEPAWFPWPDQLNPDDVFCYHYTRVLARDNTVSLHGIRYDVAPSPHARPGLRVTVHQHFDRTVRVFYGSQLLAHIPPAAEPRTPRRPGPNHPWRRSPI